MIGGKVQERLRLRVVVRRRVIYRKEYKATFIVRHSLHKRGYKDPVIYCPLIMP